MLENNRNCNVTMARNVWVTRVLIEMFWTPPQCGDLVDFVVMTSSYNSFLFVTFLFLTEKPQSKCDNFEFLSIGQHTDQSTTTDNYWLAVVGHLYMDSNPLEAVQWQIIDNMTTGLGNCTLCRFAHQFLLACANGSYMQQTGNNCLHSSVNNITSGSQLSGSRKRIYDSRITDISGNEQEEGGFPTTPSNSTLLTLFSAHFGSLILVYILGG